MQNRLRILAWLYLLVAACNGATELGDQWRFPASRSPEAFNAVASDGGKLRLIDSKTLYAADLNGRSLRPILSPGELTDLACYNGQWIATGPFGGVLRSTDGDLWNLEETGSGSPLGAICGGPAGWIALISSATGNQYVYSSDGRNWEVRSFDSFYPDSISWADGTWIAISFSGVRTSTDAVRWHSATGSPQPRAVTWTGSRWIGISSGSISQSPDGAHWAAVEGNVGSSDVITSHAGISVAVGSSGGIHCDDGVSGWRKILSLPNLTLKSVIWSGSRFIAAGSDATLLSSPDGIHWDLLESHSSNQFSAVAAGPHGFVAATVSEICFSADGFEWKRTSIPSSIFANDVIWFHDRWYLLSSDTIWSSPDGLKWDSRYPTDSASLLAIASSDQRMIAVGHDGAIRIKDTAHDWQAVPSPVSAVLRCIAWNGTRFVAGGMNGAVAWSDDGLSWQSANSGITMEGIHWSGSRFVGVGYDGEIVSSPDGTSWITLAATGYNPLYCIAGDEGELTAYGWAGAYRQNAQGGWTKFAVSGIAKDVVKKDGLWVMVGNYGLLATSSDGISWTYRQGWSAGASFVTWRAGRFVALAGGALTSEDGELWTSHPIERWDDLEDLCNGPEGFLAIGRNGTLCRSADGLHWTTESLPGGDWWAKIIPFRDGYLAVTFGGKTAVYHPGSGWSYGNFQPPGGVLGIGSLTASPSTAVCTTGSEALLTSSDGLSWTYRTAPIKDVLWDGERFIGSGSWSSSASTSPDGIVWTPRDPATYPPGLWQGKFSGRYFVSSQAGGFLAGTPESGWKVPLSPGPGPPKKIAFDGHRLVCCGWPGLILSGGSSGKSFREWAGDSGIDPGQAGFSADSDGDGIENGIAYLMGAPDAHSRPMGAPLAIGSPPSPGNPLSLRLPRPWPPVGDVEEQLVHAAAPDGPWIPIAHRTPYGWVADTPSATLRLQEDGRTLEVLTEPAEGSPRGFFRVETTLAE